MKLKSVNEWLHERGFDEMDFPSREGCNFAPSRRGHSGSLASAEAVNLEEDIVEEREIMESATNTQKVLRRSAEAEKPIMPK